MNLTLGRRTKGLDTPSRWNGPGALNIPPSTGCWRDSRVSPNCASLLGGGKRTCAMVSPKQRSRYRGRWLVRGMWRFCRDVCNCGKNHDSLGSDIEFIRSGNAFGVRPMNEVTREAIRTIRHHGARRASRAIDGSLLGSNRTSWCKPMPMRTFGCPAPMGSSRACSGVIVGAQHWHNVQRRPCPRSGSGLHPR
jgi:hypothetical protein